MTMFPALFDMLPIWWPGHCQTEEKKLLSTSITFSARATLSHPNLFRNIPKTSQNRWHIRWYGTFLTNSNRRRWHLSDCVRHKWFSLVSPSHWAASMWTANAFWWNVVIAYPVWIRSQAHWSHSTLSYLWHSIVVHSKMSASFCRA